MSLLKMATASTSEVKSTSKLKYDLIQLHKDLKYLRVNFYKDISSTNVDTPLICEVVDESRSLTGIFERRAMVVSPDGQVYCWNVITGQLFWAIKTGAGINEASQNLEDSDPHPYIVIGDDSAFYKCYKNEKRSPIKLPYGTEELFRELQEVSHDRSLSVSVKTTVFSLDSLTGKVISTFKSDEDSSSNDNPQIPSEYLDGGAELIYLKRTDYDLTHYSLPTGNVLWYLRFAEFEASSECDCDYCLGKIETTQAKLLHQVHNNVCQVYHFSEFWKFLSRNNLHLPIENRLRVGKFSLSDKQIGKGTNNTTFLEGASDGRPATVKRISKVDGDDDVWDKIQWYTVEEDQQIVHNALEPCICSLQELILGQSDSAETMTRINDFKSMNDDGYPSPELLALLREIANQLAIIHQSRRTHGDLKPQSIMIYKRAESFYFTVNLGPVFKRAKDNASEDMEKDMLDFGHLLLYCFSGGWYLYGNTLTFDMNIVRSNIYRTMREKIPEAYDLISKLTQSDEMRLTAAELNLHYLLWDPSIRLSYLFEAFKYLQFYPNDEELKDMEILCFDGNWGIKLHTEVLSYLDRHLIICKYDSVSDMLLAISFIADQYQKLPNEVRNVIGEYPTGFEYYFTSRFPKLLMGVHKVLWKNRTKYEDPLPAKYPEFWDSSEYKYFYKRYFRE